VISRHYFSQASHKQITNDALHIEVS